MHCKLTVLLWPAAAVMFAADLNVREVVLYKHGIGYFERAGQLGPGESARLDFKASEMNDVLKSLTIEEKGAGKISGVHYDSSEPLDRKLGIFPFRIRDQQPLSEILDQLKGARVELALGSGNIGGTIVTGRAAVTASSGDNPKPAEREQVTLLLDSGELRRFDLAAISGVRFTDPKLQTQFKDYLNTILNSRSQEKRSVYIDSTDAKSRDLIASYAIPTPIWKSSYRLIFEPNAQPTLEGWAIVDNTTGEDWTKIQLSLVSGRPISFISKLYEPRYIQRPEAELPENQVVAPVIHAGSIGGAPMAGLAGAAPGPAAKARREAEERLQVASSVASTADTRELGELFEYRIATPVTIRKGESAMLPFVQQKINARKLLIYTDPNSMYPMNAAELTNTTEKTLDGGPITVFDGRAYGGEALMETLKAGDKRLISYAVDLGTRITTRFDSRATTVREIHLRRGILTTRTAAVETKTYTIRNVDNKPKILIIEHPARPEYKLLDRQPAETTASAYRFEVKLASGATDKFPVTEERVYDSSTGLANLTPDVLITYIQNKALSDAARKQLEQVMRQKQQIAAAENEIRRINSDTNELMKDQERLRQNIQSLNNVSGQQDLVQRYARQLADQESKLASLRDHAAELERKKARLESELNSMIEKMEF